jgi:hypothetical protein
MVVIQLFIYPFITYSVLRHVRSRFQSKNFTEYHLAFPVSIYVSPPFLKAGLKEPVTRMTTVARGNLSLARGIPFCPIFFLLPDQRLYAVKNVCVCVCVCLCIRTHTSDCVGIVCELLLLPNNTASDTFLHKSGAVRSVDWIFIIGASDLTMTGRIRDFRHNVLKFSLKGILLQRHLLPNFLP